MDRAQQPVKRKASPEREDPETLSMLNMPKKQLLEDSAPEDTLKVLSEDKARIYMGNLPKRIQESDLRQLFHDKQIRSLSLYCNKSSYHPTAAAYISFGTRQECLDALKLNHSHFKGKRLLVGNCKKRKFFWPDYSVMLKNLDKNMTEEKIFEEVEKLVGENTVEAVLKPAHHYAYVELKRAVKKKHKIHNAHKGLVPLRKHFRKLKIDVFPLYFRVYQYLVPTQSHIISSVEGLRRSSQHVLQFDEIPSTDENFGIHNNHKVFVGNIPRDTQAEDLIDYFNCFGNVVDYQRIEKRSCHLRKSVILSFESSDHAKNAYRQSPHYFEGAQLDVHLMDVPPFQFKSNNGVLTVKSHSKFLTIDEVRYALSALKYIDHRCSMRFDAFDDQANFIFNLKTYAVPIDQLKQDIQYINDEAVVFVEGLDLTPPEPDEAVEKQDVASSEKRQQKEDYLRSVVDKETLKEDLQMLTDTTLDFKLPFNTFYNSSSVQINNVSLPTTVEDIRHLFIKCGNIVEYKALVLKEDRSKICYVKFETDLSADLACTYNQRKVNGRRILVHLANETLRVEHLNSLLVERLSAQTRAEEVYKAFQCVSRIKYVQKLSPTTAIVCFKDKDCMENVVNVKTIRNCGPFITSPCRDEYDACFYNNFTCNEEIRSAKRICKALHPRRRSEFHQTEIETRFVNTIRLTMNEIPNFSTMTKEQQIDMLKTNLEINQEHSIRRINFCRFTLREQEKLLDMAKNMENDKPPESAKDPEISAPPAKRVRRKKPRKKPVNKQQHDTYQVNPSKQLQKYDQNPYYEVVQPAFEPRTFDVPFVRPGVSSQRADFVQHRQTGPVPSSHSAINPEFERARRKMAALMNKNKATSS